ncbi:hypothetical protein N7532_004721 [Penicillium argentinense]|uniref:Uncharacterized protein n=1 Tax=Penicillium argentinense TaxID=1131581 RepID=A0A9W9KGE9_9EURO|nr:uncharacterized protein N7532_004721 [Penicillium argentinense]KAJ5104192.1 hypothetical protein N7532_004721 [Penicillium argentinense]
MLVREIPLIGAWKESSRKPGATYQNYINSKMHSGEEKPMCLNCQRQGESCDYSVRLNWGGRTKRASVDSPRSQSSGYGGTVIGFDPMPTSAANQTQVPTPGSNHPSDGFINFRSGDLGSPDAISPGTAAHMGMFDSPKPQSGPDSIHSPSQGEVNFASTWADHSTVSAAATSASLTGYPFGPSFHGSISTAADQGVGLRSLSAFAFHANSVSQPESFLRNSVDETNHSTNHNNDGGQMNHHGMGYGRDLSGHDDILALLGSHESSTGGARTTGSSAHDRGAVRSMNAPRSESLHSLHHAEEEQATKDSALAQSKWQAYLTSVTDNYGLDCGRPDQDLALNNDHAAIDINSALDSIAMKSRNGDSASPSAPWASPATQSNDYTGYYASPVPINIPRYLSPLPRTLLENPINLMYFHHFLNHTSRMLVPHDCENNPFLSVLPSMATGDPNLLNLLLAYSASHRARYLGQPEPANRIAHWVSEVFPALRVALEASPENITDSHLATAILLLSLKIVSPSTFEVPITWQSHLKLARDLFLARSERIARPGNRIGAFFARWLGYLDTMGALSCRQAGPPLMLYHTVLAACCGSEHHDEFAVDCFTGFTPRTGAFFIRLGRLVQQCDNERFDEQGTFRPTWHPSADVVMEAQAVLGDIEGLSECAHANPDHHKDECQDMLAIEEAFRSAGLVHLHRRVLGSSPDSFPVKDALRKLIGALERMPSNAPAEFCSLFPLFTAGCESRDASQRMKLLNRFFMLEKSGLKQIQHARQLMQQCWDDQLPWIALAEGQFLG